MWSTGAPGGGDKRGMPFRLAEAFWLMHRWCIASVQTSSCLQPLQHCTVPATAGCKLRRLLASCAGRPKHCPCTTLPFHSMQVPTKDHQINGYTVSTKYCTTCRWAAEGQQQPLSQAKGLAR